MKFVLCIVKLSKTQSLCTQSSEQRVCGHQTMLCAVIGSAISITPLGASSIVFRVLCSRILSIEIFVCQIRSCYLIIKLYLQLYILYIFPSSCMPHSKILLNFEIVVQ